MSDTKSKKLPRNQIRKLKIRCPKCQTEVTLIGLFDHCNRMHLKEVNQAILEAFEKDIWVLNERAELLIEKGLL